MSAALDTLALALDPSRILAAQGMTPDPWQRRFLLSENPRTLLCCSHSRSGCNSWPTEVARNTLSRLKAGARHAKLRS